MQVFVIFPAAGLGTRMAGPPAKHPNDLGSASHASAAGPPKHVNDKDTQAGPLPKQFLALEGVPIIDLIDRLTIRLIDSIESDSMNESIFDIIDIDSIL